MRVVIQRVTQASVSVNPTGEHTPAYGHKCSDDSRTKVLGKIEKGMLILVSIEDADTTEDIAWITKKIVNLRIFDDQAGVMNLSVKDINGDILLISQFTLHAQTAKGNRPSYIKAAKPDVAIPIYQKLIESLQQAMEKEIATGEFGADMTVEITNDGPVTILIDSTKLF